MNRPAINADGRKVVVHNRRARHDYEILDTLEAGLALTGGEIKSIRAGGVQLADAYAEVKHGEAWLHNMHIAPYTHAGSVLADPKRPRKLLLHRREIDRLIGRVQEKGLTLIPLDVHLRRGFAKVELALARGRKRWDRRRDIEAKDVRRERDTEVARYR